MRSRGLLGCLLVAFVASGCGGKKPTTSPSPAVQREVAGRFATALLLRGDAAGARALLVARSDGALVFLVQQAVAPWKGRPTSVSLPARRAGAYWAVAFARRRTQRNGSFETQRGDLVMSIAQSKVGVRVAFFTFENLQTRFSTHRDSQLLPSKR
jgi:hypothetical protein